MTRDSLSGVLFALLAAIGFSAKAIFIKLAYLDEVDAITLLALRMAFAVPFFIGVAIWLERNGSAKFSRKDWMTLVGLGLMGYYLASLFDFLGLQYVSAGLERLILFIYPTITIVLSAFLFKKRITPAVYVAMALSYAGIAMVVLHDVNMLGKLEGAGQGQILLGAGLIFASAVTYSIYLVGAGHAIQHMGATRFTAYASIVSSLAALLQFALTHSWTSLHLTWRVYEMSLAMAIFSTVLPVFMLSYAMRHIGSGHTAQIGAVGPVVTIFLAYVFLGENITPLQMGGTALVLAGVLMISLSAKK